MSGSPNNLTKTPLYQILKIVSLEAYAGKLAELGYAYDLKSLSNMPKDQLSYLYQRIQVPSELIIKFQDVIELMKYLKPRRSNRSISREKSSDSPSRLRRNSFVCRKTKEENQFDNLTTLYNDYNSKIEKEIEEEKNQANIKMQL